MRRLLGALLALSTCAATASGGNVTTLRDVGPDDNRLVFAIVGDGYLDTQEADFLADAQQALDGLLGVSPYREYAAWINAHADFVPSNEQGADKPAPCFGTPVERDTAFDATYCTGGTRRLLTVNRSAVFALLNADIPTWDVAAIVVNDTEYGGAGGSVLTFSTDPGAMIELFLHEAGHTFGRLADEYESYPDPYPGSEPSEPNVTTDLDPATTKWGPWIDPATPLPTPGALNWEPGLYEGGRYYATGIYRPVNDCKMRSLNRAFCAICKEGHVQELHARVSPLDAARPEPGELELSACEPRLFELELLAIDPPTLEVEWLLDGAPLPGETAPTLALDPGRVPPGGAELVARVVDATPLVRRPYLTPMTAEASWTLTVEGGGDLDGDGLLDACDPDVDGDLVPNDEDCAPLDGAVSGPAREVARLDLARDGATALLAWEDVVGLDGRPGGSHAVLAGDLIALRETSSFEDACLVAHVPAASLADARPLPAGSPSARWYLVGVVDDCGAGSLGASGPVGPELRAELDPTLLPDCP